MSDSAEFQLLERNLDRFPAGRYLLINAPKGSWPGQFARDREVQMLDWLFDSHKQHQQLPGLQDKAQFAAWPDHGDFDHVILFWPKEKALVPLLCDYLASMPAKQLPNLWLCGHNNGGIKSAPGLLKKLAMRATKVDSARHCTLIHTQLASKTVQPMQAILSASASEYRLQVDSSEIALRTYPGVFSSGELDAGTELLLQHLPPMAEQRVLDFGCGCGVISCVLAKRFPRLNIIGVDVNAFALQASRDNFVTNGINAEAKAVAGIHDLSGERFDIIITNPPFHQGTRTDYDVTEQLIAAAPELLNRGGQLLMVANRFLKYPDKIEQAFGHCITVAQNNKFSIYRAEI